MGKLVCRQRHWCPWDHVGWDAVSKHSGTAGLSAHMSGYGVMCVMWVPTPHACAQGGGPHGVSGCTLVCIEEGQSWQELGEKLGEQGVGSRAWGHCSWKAAC